MRLLKTLAVLAVAAGTASAQTGSNPPATDSATHPRDVWLSGPGMPARQPQGPVRISGGVMAGMVQKVVAPIRPGTLDASGIVVLHAIIGKDGHIKSLKAIAGPMLLQQPALDAVSQWVYTPYRLNGQSVEVDTTITVQFGAR